MVRGDNMEKRNTKQKSLVRKIVRDLNTHACAEEIYHRVIKVNPRISLATVYRILHEMVDTQELREVANGSGATVFDPTTHPHYHIQCIKCNQLFDVDIPYHENLDNELRDKTSFSILSHDLTFKGICTRCTPKN
jgi:Fe2+ or Zn2+ uptake regulation protein